jgi:hypothetical protein
MRLTRPILAAVAVALVGLVVYRRTVPRRNPAPREAGGQYVLQIHSLPVTHNLALGEFEVPAKGTHDVTIALDEPRMQNARLSGYFSTTGGAGIQVMLLDNAQYTRLQNRQTPSEFLFLSKTAQAGNIEAMIPSAGTYYLIFDNSASDSSIKVKSDVSVHYETMQVDSGTSQKK